MFLDVTRHLMIFKLKRRLDTYANDLKFVYPNDFGYTNMAKY